jgi:hypothetical protein
MLYPNTDGHTSTSVRFKQSMFQATLHLAFTLIPSSEALTPTEHRLLRSYTFLFTSIFSIKAQAGILRTNISKFSDLSEILEKEKP